MSSFKADVHFGGQEFKATPFFGAQAAGSDVGQSASAFEAGAGFGFSSTKNGSSEEGESQWTPEQVEALEQAAFARGEESARESNENSSRVCGILEAAARELAQVASTSITTNRGLLLALAMEIAQKWVAEELKLDPTLFAKALNRVIASCEPNDGATLFLHPSDRATLLEMEGERVSLWQDEYQLDIAEDEAIRPGMFRIEGPSQTIDGTDKGISDRLRDALDEAFEADLPEVTL